MFVRCATILVVIGLAQSTMNIYSLIQHINRSWRAVDESSYEKEKEYCSYEGYSPAFQPQIINEGHPTARILLDALTSNFIGTEMLEGTAIIASAGPATDILVQVKTRLSEAVEYTSRTKAIILNGLGRMNGILKHTALISPVLGILSAALGAAIAVNTPTYEDILAATNKALEEMMDELDRRLDLMKDYVDEKVIETDKHINKRRYTFLFSYWMRCGNLKTKEDIEFCQQEAHRLIMASSNDFLIYQARLNEAQTKFVDLSDEERRRIEVGMVNFRNYAVLALVSLNTLAATYEINSKNVQKQCAELLWEREMSAEKSVDEKSGPMTDKLYACLFREELNTKAAFFVKYGYAAIEEIKLVARSRLAKPLSTAVVTKCEPAIPSDAQSRNMKGDYVEHRCTCDGQIHPMKDGKCEYKLTLTELPDSQYFWEKRFYKENTVMTTLTNIFPLGQYKNTTELIDGDLVQARKNEGHSAHYWDPNERSTTEIWCEKKFERRRKEYASMEQEDIQSYWNNEIMKVVKCGDLLAEKKIEECTKDKLQSHYPEFYESVITLTNPMYYGGTKGKTDAGRAIDGLLSTASLTEIAQKSEWSADLKRTAIISKVYLYIGASSESRDSYFLGSGEYPEVGFTEWGQWAPERLDCKSPITGFRIRNSGASRGGMTGLQFKCKDGTESNQASDETGNWGAWTKCPEGQHVKELKLRGQSDQGRTSNDLGATNLRIKCIDSTVAPSNMDEQRGLKELDGTGVDKGRWTPWNGCANNEHLCGARVKISEALGDETGVNSMTFTCCKGYYNKVEVVAENERGQKRKCQDMSDVSRTAWDKPIIFKCDLSGVPFLANKVIVRVEEEDEWLSDFLKLSEVKVFGYDEPPPVSEAPEASRITLQGPSQMDESDKCESNSQPSNAAKKAIDGDISTWSGTCVPIAQSGSDGSSSRTAYWEADINSGSGKKYIVQSIAILVKGKYKSLSLRLPTDQENVVRECGQPGVDVSDTGPGYLRRKCTAEKEKWHTGIRVEAELDYPDTDRLMIKEIIVTAREVTAKKKKLKKKGKVTKSLQE